MTVEQEYTQVAAEYRRNHRRLLTATVTALRNAGRLTARGGSHPEGGAAALVPTR